jgi:hypothetical protein
MQQQLSSQSAVSLPAHILLCTAAAATLLLLEEDDDEGTFKLPYDPSFLPSNSISFSFSHLRQIIVLLLLMVETGAAARAAEAMM